jgi:phosphoglycerate dehydrogenase-like enzyme
MSDLIVGIIGYGRIGAMTADRLRVFGCTVLTNGRSGNGPDPRDLATLLAHSDAVVVHVPLTPETHHLIDAGRIAQMRRGRIWSTSAAGRWWMPMRCSPRSTAASFRALAWT